MLSVPWICGFYGMNQGENAITMIWKKKTGFLHGIYWDKGVISIDIYIYILYMEKSTDFFMGFIGI